MIAASDDDPRIDELFTLPPEDFTAARNRLVRQLRAEGQRDVADTVRSLRRPTVAAWAVNQTVRAHPQQFAGLLAAGEAVRAAQRRALSGVRRGGMREATRARREHIDELARLAADTLRAHGVTADAHQADIVATFDAASADEAAATRVAAARLSHALPVSSDVDALEGLTVLTTELEDLDDVEDGGGRGDEDGGGSADDAARQQAALARREAIRTVSDVRRRLKAAHVEAERADAEAQRARARSDIADRAAKAAEDTARRLRIDAHVLAERASSARDRADEAAREAQQLAAELEARQRELEALD